MAFQTPDPTQSAKLVPSSHSRSSAVLNDLHHPSKKTSTWFWPLLIVAAGLLITALSVVWELTQIAHNDRQRFNVLSERIKGEIVRRVGVYRYGLVGALSVFTASKSVERSEFKALAITRNLPVEFPGALGLGYIQRIPRPDTENFEKATQADEAPGFHVRAGLDPKYVYVVKFIEPELSNQNALGFDITSEPIRRKAADHAMLTGEATLTAKISLITFSQDEPGFLYLLPFYRNGTHPTSAQEREQALEGWVYMPLAARQIFKGAIGAAEGEVDFEVFDGEMSIDNLVYDDDEHLKGQKGQIDASHFKGRMFEAFVPVEIGGRTWTVAMSTGPAFRASSRTPAWATGIAGILLTFALASLVYTLGSTARRARNIALELTADLKRLALVAQRTTNAVIITDAHERIVWVNEGFQKICGYTFEEAQGQVPGRFLQCQRTDPAVRRAIHEAVREGKGCRAEILNQAKDGHEYVVDMEIQPLHDENGALTGFIAVETDITAQVKARELLDSKERLLRTMTDRSRQLAGILSPDGRVVDLNQTAMDFARITDKDKIVGQYFWDTPWWSHSTSLQEWLRGAIARAAAGERIQHETTHTGRDGMLHIIDFSITPVVGSDGKVILLIPEGYDITPIKQITQALSEARDSAHAATRSKSEFLANMSHEIRTPMTAILGYTDLLAEEWQGITIPQRLEYITTIKRNGEHLLSIINDILDLSKIESGKMSVEQIDTHPDQIIHDVVSLMQVKAQGKGIRLDVQYLTPVPARIQSDPLRLRQILVNLVGNAIKFTDYGAVTLRIALDSNQPGGPALRFQVNDTGIGMTPEQIGRLFGAFEQADTSTTRKFGGTGLGLKISKRLAEMLGGDITITSEVGKGSTFTLTLKTGSLLNVENIDPSKAAQVVREKETPSMIDLHPETLAGARIMLVEDGPDNRRLVSFYLRKAGAEVISFENGELAVKALTQDGTLDGPLRSPPPVNMILMDMQMPVMDGYSASRLMRAKGCTLPIVALTAHAMSGDAEKCLEAGCDDYVAKPIDKYRLITMSATWITTRLSLSTPNTPTPNTAISRSSAPSPASPNTSAQPAVTQPPPPQSEPEIDPDMAELVQEFVQSLPARMDSIQLHFKTGQVAALEQEAHQLAGAAGGYGFPRITTAARTLEQGLRTHQETSTITHAVDELLSVCAQTAQSRTK